MGYTCRRRWADYVHAMEGKLRYRRRMDVVIRLTRGDDGIAAAEFEISRKIGYKVSRG